MNAKSLETVGFLLFEISIIKADMVLFTLDNKDPTIPVVACVCGYSVKQICSCISLGFLGNKKEFWQNKIDNILLAE
jgi:hypothetical protein